MGDMLCRDGQRWTTIRLRLFRGRAGSAISGQAARQRWGAPHRSHYCEAAGIVAGELPWLAGYSPF
jgi:hypothetical protein